MIQGHFASSLARPAAALLVLLSLAFPLRVHASAQDETNQAVAAAKSWVEQIDAGKYEDSYSFACDETRNRYPQDQWVNVLRALRGPWGALVDRHQLSHIYQPNGVTGLSGECMVITYNTNFKNYSNVTEQITLKWQDGQWRGAAYFAGVVPDPNAPAAAPNYTTEVHTQPHVSGSPHDQ